MNRLSRLRIHRTMAAVLAAVATVVTGCGEEAAGPPVGPAPVESEPDATAPAKPLPPLVRAPSSKADVASVVEGNNSFAFDLYVRLRSNEGNLIFSPYSISTALAMTYAGARGGTAAEMHSTLHFPSEPLDMPDGELPWEQTRLHGAMAALVDDLNARGGKGAYELVVANRLWGQAGYRFLAPFIALNRTYYGAGLERVDFARATEPSRRTINDWVERQTREKIKDLLKPGVLTPVTTLVLTNAIYFKGNWASRFKEKDTSDAPFHVTPRKAVDVPVMRQTAKFGYTETEGIQVLEMPYVGDDLSMVVVLPRKVDGLAGVEAALDAGSLHAWLTRIRERKVAVFLPKFKVEFGLDLAVTLAAMGMPSAFGAGADFSGMDGTRSLFISAVIHKAFVEVNETGTEAAAATAVVMTRGVSRTPVFRADRPFVFLIRDRATGSVLFIGRVTDPSA